MGSRRCRCSRWKAIIPVPSSLEPANTVAKPKIIEWGPYHRQLNTRIAANDTTAIASLFQLLPRKPRSPDLIDGVMSPAGLHAPVIEGRPSYGPPRLLRATSGGSHSICSRRYSDASLRMAQCVVPPPHMIEGIYHIDQKAFTFRPPCSPSTALLPGAILNQARRLYEAATNLRGI